MRRANYPVEQFIPNLISSTKGSDIHVDVDEAELDRDFRWVRTRWTVLRDLDDKAGWTRRKKHAALIATAAKRLVTLLDAEEGRWLLARATPGDPDLDLGFLDEVDRMALHAGMVANSELSEFLRSPTPPLNHLVGGLLVPLFEKHFRTQVEIGTPANVSLDRPFIRFAQLCFEHLKLKTANGKPYKFSSIAYALRDYRANEGLRLEGKFGAK